ncbi:MAG: HDOD domain-containing protein [Pseudomonadota bacterium]
MTEQKADPAKPMEISIARRPVFDINRRLWGYELFCVGGRGAPAASADGQEVAVSVAASSYMGLQQVLEREKTILVDFNEQSLLAQMPYALPPAGTVVMVDEAMHRLPKVMKALIRFKSDGFRAAVNHFTGDPEVAPLHALADFFRISLKGKGKDRLSPLVTAAEAFSAQLLAAEVETPAAFSMCREMGFSLFSGAFFKKPDEISMRQLSSGEVSRFHLLRALEQEDPDMEALVQAIQTDVSISLRLLAYLNSAAFGFRQKINSIQQAVTLLGWRRMKNWLRVVLLSDMGQHKESQELALLAAQRGRFLEQVALDHDFWGFAPDSLHLLGMFSLLDAMLGAPMASIVGHLPLDNALKDALCGSTNSEYYPLLQLAQALEEGRWKEGEMMMRQLNLDSEKAWAAFQQAVDWASELSTMDKTA